MIPSFQKIHQFLENNIISICNKKIHKKLQNYTFLYASEAVDIFDNKSINKNLNESNIILINQYKEHSLKTFFIIGFRKTILILETNLFPIIQSHLLDKNPKICFLSKNIDNSNHCFDNLKIEKNIGDNFSKEIYNFNYHLSLHKSCSKDFVYIWNIIKPNISGYLIVESYEKTKIDRLNNLFANDDNRATSSTEIINHDEFIELKDIGIGSLNNVQLIYHIEKEELFALKKPNSFDAETEKLIQREIENYQKIQHPLLPKFIGTNENKNYIIIEFISGKTLFDAIKNQIFSFDQKIIWIFELMMIIEYLHKKHFIFRDLKSNNIMIDVNNILVLLDLDRMISAENSLNSFSYDFTPFFAAPELDWHNYTYESDIYSLGCIINYLFESENNNEMNLKEIILINEIIHKCTEEMPEKRLSILEIILIFFIKFHYKIKIENIFEKYIKKLIECYNLNKRQEIEIDIKNKANIQYFLGYIYFERQFGQQNIDEAIQYFTIAAKKNHLQAQYFLGKLYSENIFIPKCGSKAVYYYTLAAKQNLAEAQYNLGLIYAKNELILCNLNMAIYYLTFAANQNHLQAQFELARIYENGKYSNYNNDDKYFYHLFINQSESMFLLNNYNILNDVSIIREDLEKYYQILKLSDQQDQNQIQLIRNKVKFIQCDINKAIYYYSLASNQNLPDAQFRLGIIYIIGKNKNKNINKGLYYLYLAAKQNYSKAQFYLGLIYYLGTMIPFDINKAMSYYTLSAEQNYLPAQICLGFIYLEGKFIKKNIEKSIHYFTLAANQNSFYAQFYLGIIYKKEKIDIEKSIYYLSLSAKQNFSPAQYCLGIMYFSGINVSGNAKKGIDFLTLAAENNYYLAEFTVGILMLEGIYMKQNIEKAIYYLNMSSDKYDKSFFVLGYLYHTGSYVIKDIEKALFYYKKASLTFFYAYNNLGMIYKHGNKKELYYAIEYFQDAIKTRNDYISMYNLAHLHIYQEPFEDSIEKAISYLIKSANQNFYPSVILLSLISIIKFGYDVEIIIQELNKRELISNVLSAKIQNTIKFNGLDEIDNLINCYNEYHDIEYIYHFSLFPIK